MLKDSMFKKIYLGLSILSLATSIVSAAYFICCKKKSANKERKY